MTVEEVVVCERLHGRLGAGKFVAGGTNDGALGKFGADEFAGNREDEIGLELWSSRGDIEIGKSETVVVDRIRRVVETERGTLHGVAGEIDPFEKVSDFIAADGHGDFQDFAAGDFKGHQGGHPSWGKQFMDARAFASRADRWCS